MIGVSICREGARSYVNVLFTGLDGEPIDLVGDARTSPIQREVPDGSSLVEVIAKLIGDYSKLEGLSTRRILGVGVSIPGHVVDGNYIAQSSIESAQKVKLGSDLARRLFGLSKPLAAFTGQSTPLPVIIDNDINVLAVEETYRARALNRDLVVVGVLDDGVGSALVLNSQVYRGARGMSGEVGHCAVPVEASSQEIAEVFDSDRDEKDYSLPDVAERKLGFGTPAVVVGGAMLIATQHRLGYSAN